MRPVFPLIILLFTFYGAKAQYEERMVFYDVQFNMGLTTNVNRAEKIGYGVTVQAFLPINENNYFIAGIKCLSNPFDGEKYSVFRNGFNKKGDALNYGMLLTGLRIALKSFEYGNIFFEPKAGMGFAHGFHWTGFSISPSLGYEVDGLEFLCFFDSGFGDTKLNTKKKSFLTPGIGIGYIF